MVEPRETEPTGARERASRRRLRPPVQRAHLAERALVLRSLDVARAGKLTIVVGPRGYGKSTALGQWWHRLSAQGIAAAWYTASDLDREPDVFLEMIARALSAAGIEMGDAMRPKTGDSPLAIMLDAILLQLDRDPRPIVLIIDDFDRVDHPGVARLVEEMADALPDRVHLVLATRRKPSLAVSVLRTQGIVRIIDPAELRLSDAELAAALGLPADAPELAAIAEQTEGWPVAVQLYRLWRGRMGDSVRMPRFSGQVDEVADYLAEQVFGMLPEHFQTLLTDLAPFDYVEASLADHVRDRRDSAALLEEVEAELPTLVQRTEYEGEPAWRLHPLLSDYAQARLSRSPDHAARLHRRAADWLWRQQRYAASVRHYDLAGDRATMVETLGGIPFISIFLAYGAGELRAILRETPPEVLEALPRLQLMAALAHFKAGHFGEASNWLHRIGQSTGGFLDDPSGCGKQLELEGRALDLLFECYINGTKPTREAEVEAVRALAPDAPLFWAWCENTMIVMYQMRGDLHAARQSVIRTRDTYQALGILPFAEQHLMTHDVLVAFAHGSLRAASEFAAATLRRRGTGGIEPTVTATARMAIAAIDYLRHYRESAADLVRVAFDQFGAGEAWYDQYAISWPVIADVAWRRSGLPAALRLIAELRTRLDNQGLLCVGDLLKALEAIYRLRGGGIDGAEAIARTLPVDADHVPWRTRDLVLQARVLVDLARGRVAAAGDGARTMIEEGRTGERLVTMVKGYVLLALVRDRLGDEAGADEAMAAAVHHAFAEEILSPFVEEGSPVRVVVERILGAAPPLEQQHAETILRALKAKPQYLSPDALNERESEIVAHLADGASNKLIARRLGLTENTIKFHLKKVYAKLGVSSRKGAVARAQEK
ncbi:LuxR C-terminal-related transcriptional regulator [Sphingosinicella soli]|uniref:LuxR C-terminal-related transcriptional regulator n=1 Tax=Sphingosinicella soli TaxID=333708 RepID=UPI00311C9B60